MPGACRYIIASIVNHRISATIVKGFQPGSKCCTIKQDSWLQCQQGSSYATITIALLFRILCQPFFDTALFICHLFFLHPWLQATRIRRIARIIATIECII